MLEVGCGQGELTTALVVAGYDMLGIDPLAPQGDLFRRVRLEDLEDDEGEFDGVVAVRSLHPIRDLATGSTALRRCSSRARSSSSTRSGGT